jgi:hypothetical protein
MRTRREAESSTFGSELSQIAVNLSEPQGVSKTTKKLFLKVVMKNSFFSSFISIVKVVEDVDVEETRPSVQGWTRICGLSVNLPY